MPDYMYLMESRLSPEQRELLALVQEIAQAQETNVYLTGGGVRGLITGMPIRDLDLTVEGNPSRMARELEKRGARVLEENERLRHIEMAFKGETDFSLAAARDDVYEHPGARPEVRWCPVMDDLRRRDISINAIAISLNPASRGLLLDPTNGLSDVEKREVRVLSMHSFTNQPIRLLRVIRYAARLDFKVEQRTSDWLQLAMERGLSEQITGAALGAEIRQLTREERCIQVLKAWGARGLLGTIHPRLEKRLPDYDGLAKLMRAREAMMASRIVPRLFAPVTYYLLARLSPGERSAALRKMELRSSEIESVQHLEHDTAKVVKVLKGRKTAKPRDAYYCLESVRPDLLAFILASVKQSKVLSKVRMYLAKWRPLKMSLPVAELESLGVEHGAKFDKILLDLFHVQLAGRARNPQDRLRVLRNLAGIKPEPKKKEKEKLLKKKGKAAEAPKAVVVPAGKGRGRKAGPSPAELEGESEPSTLDLDLAGGGDEEETPLPEGKVAVGKGEEEGDDEEETVRPSKGKAATTQKKPAAKKKLASRPASKPKHSSRKAKPKAASRSKKRR